MGVGIQCYADVCMTRDVLQCLEVHPGFCHIGADGVSAHMRSYFRHLDVDPILVSAELLLLFNGFQKIPFLFPADGFSYH